MNTQLPLMQTPGSTESPSGSLASKACTFCDTTPHRSEPYGRRAWGGRLHSLCSYQGKLKPSIAHFLIKWFTEPGWRVLDPMAGVGTIPLEARRMGRVGIANDLSALAACVARAKLEVFQPGEVAKVFDQLARALRDGPSLDRLAAETDIQFGLNGPIQDYFHPETLREVLIARRYFIRLRESERDVASDVVKSGLLHILHGNRPYALSRRSHPVTPLTPTGDFEYRPLLDRLSVRLSSIVSRLQELRLSSLAGQSIQGDFRDLDVEPVHAVITSPPFAKSLRFWSSNWMRLWFSGWSPEDFQTQPPRYLETQQRVSFAPYREFGSSMAKLLKPGGLLIMHLGETAALNMIEGVVPMIDDAFHVVHVGREGVADTESHGLRDKGATIAHWYLFATKR